MTGPDGTPAPRPRRRTPEEPFEFPVAPMLDMSFQLLAFFILTFQAPTGESRIDLYLPSAPAALVAAPDSASTGRNRPVPGATSDLETDLVVRAEADELGDLVSLSLQGSDVPDADALAGRLRRYREQLAGEPVKVRIEADDRLRYEEAARVIGACSAAGVDSVRLAGSASEAGP
ncbi:ExbD/TolR family protein [Tautonia plasticadhaerens]|uniref:Biopolymer transport protein ExbD/TolR n=1 Tax=Tautonia plasticadhaerens TaxID=2527974 RepID=A0A518H2T7_9BACT|nr:biopolymer transporter ExbD [Tautonia plasticadhaerens]QDV35140.1 Biopolymer transport protein ExbD/TolR [Tautonia plasticadhaerens]